MTINMVGGDEPIEGKGIASMELTLVGGDEPHCFHGAHPGKKDYGYHLLCHRGAS
jgi:hypothetical protein